jgi:hypothetical protein
MGNIKQKINNTQLDNLISNLRGEVGDIIITWKLLLKLTRNVSYLYTPDYEKNFSNPDIALLEILIDKLENEIISRLSELSEQKIGQLTFFFAQQKLKEQVDLSQDVNDYKRFVDKEKIRDKRNQFISHKQLPETWTEHKEILISTQTLGKCLSLAVKLMIKIDKEILGPSAIFLWREVLKKSTPPIRPLNVNFMLLPHMSLDKTTRGIIIKKEIELGLPVFETMRAKVDGEKRDVYVCKKWGGILLDSHTLLLCDGYPITGFSKINFSNRSDSLNNL